MMLSLPNVRMIIHCYQRHADENVQWNDHENAWGNDDIIISCNVHMILVNGIFQKLRMTVICRQHGRWYFTEAVVDQYRLVITYSLKKPDIFLYFKLTYSISFCICISLLFGTHPVTHILNKFEHSSATRTRMFSNKCFTSHPLQSKSCDKNQQVHTQMWIQPCCSIVNVVSIRQNDYNSTDSSRDMSDGRCGGDYMLGRRI